MKLLSILTAGFILLGCASTKQTVKSDAGESSEIQTTNNIQIKAKIGESYNADPITITRSKIEGNIAYLRIGYSGGCEDHTFEVIGSPAVMKSLPPKRSVKLIHRANGDKCRGWIEQTLEIDLSELAIEKKAGSEIILLIEGLDEEITYTYK